MRGDRLKQMRESRHLTQRELSTLCGFGEKQIWRYENDQSDPPSNHLATMAKVLNITSDYLLGLTDDPHQYYDAKLTPAEQKLLDAFDSNDVIGAMRIIIEISGKPLPDMLQSGDIPHG